MPSKSNTHEKVKIIEARSSEWELEIMIILASEFIMIVPRRRQNIVKWMQIIKYKVPEQLVNSVGTGSCEGGSCISTETQIKRATQECLQSGLVICNGITLSCWRSE